MGVAISPRLTGAAAFVGAALLVAGCDGEESDRAGPKMTAAQTSRHLSARTDPPQRVLCTAGRPPFGAFDYTCTYADGNSVGVDVDSDSVTRYSG